jgi:hypothetical protein
MIMSPAGLGTKNDCAGEGQYQFTQAQLTVGGWQLVVSQRSQLVVAREHRSRGISSVISLYQGTTGEYSTNCEDLVYAIVICRMCR